MEVPSHFARGVETWNWHAVPHDAGAVVRCNTAKCVSDGADQWIADERGDLYRPRPIRFRWTEVAAGGKSITACGVKFRRITNATCIVDGNRPFKIVPIHAN